MSPCRPTGLASLLAIGIPLISLVLISPTTSPAAPYLELEAVAAIPARVAADAYRPAVGGAVSVLSRRQNGLLVGLHLSHHGFQRAEGSDGERAYTATLLQLRLPVMERRRAQLFISIASGPYTRTIRFDAESRRRNELLPRSETAMDLGLTVGTGLAWRLGESRFRLTSNQSYTVIGTEVQASQLLAASLGIGVDLE